MNLGLIGFVLSLLSNSRQYEPYITPVMGGSILVALLAYSLRLFALKPALVKAMPGVQGNAGGIPRTCGRPLTERGAPSLAAAPLYARRMLQCEGSVALPEMA